MLDPLPILYRSDYIYHLFLNKEPNSIYKIYPEQSHELLDRFYYNTLNYSEKMLSDLPNLLVSMNEPAMMNMLESYVRENLNMVINQSKKSERNLNNIYWNKLKETDYFF